MSGDVKQMLAVIAGVGVGCYLGTSMSRRVSLWVATICFAAVVALEFARRSRIME